jgi:hypothetical protein
MGDYTIFETDNKRRIVVARYPIGKYCFRLTIEGLEDRASLSPRPYDAFLSREEANKVIEALK